MTEQTHQTHFLYTRKSRIASFISYIIHLYSTEVLLEKERFLKRSFNKITKNDIVKNVKHVENVGTFKNILLQASCDLNQNILAL